MYDGRRIFVDWAYPTVKVAVELNGYEFHGSRAAVQRDSERAVLLARIGWQYLPFTHADVTKNTNYVLSSLREVVPRSVLLGSTTAHGG